jgi:hypothetical protein
MPAADRGTTTGMSDRLHDHLTLELSPGCVACAQLAADLAVCAESSAPAQAS